MASSGAICSFGVMADNPYNPPSIPAKPVTWSKPFALSLVLIAVVSSFALGTAFGYELGVYHYRSSVTTSLDDHHPLQPQPRR